MDLLQKVSHDQRGQETYMNVGSTSRNTVPEVFPVLRCLFSQKGIVDEWSHAPFRAKPRTAIDRHCGKTHLAVASAKNQPLRSLRMRILDLGNGERASEFLI